MIFQQRKSCFQNVLGLLTAFLMMACSSESELLPEEMPDEESAPSSEAVKVVSVSADDIMSGNGDSRSTFSLEDDRLKFSWTEGDQIGVCPSSGTQIAFTIKSGAGNNTAKFDGGAWELRETETYAAYYPYDVDNTAKGNTQLGFSYEGQCQTGNASLAHLGEYDWMATDATRAVDKVLNFQFEHLNSVAQFRLTIPVATVFTKLTLRCEEPIFTKTAQLDLSGEEYVYESVETTGQLSMELKEITSTEERKELLLYMTLPPVDMTGKKVYVVLHSNNNKVFQGLLDSKELKAGFAYSLAATMVDVTMSSTVASPNFGTSDKEI